ncbi:unnamed protein product [Mytilus edulis]|uniref:Uncharacterized protein n=1 Tax=Mytilus edulis TaxID=6550 RepID=A0A8S3UVZ9_MYTED|nr:unnamed protein product [Mytilus edulis]
MVRPYYLFTQKTNLNNIGNLLRKNPSDKVNKTKYYNLKKQLKTMVNQKKKLFKQNIFNKLTINFGNNSQEYWKTLKSLRPKENEDRDVGYIYENTKNAENHFKNQGACKNVNLGFQTNIEKSLKEAENNLTQNENTDSPITYSEVKKILIKI